MNFDIFKAYDVRGTYPEQIDDSSAEIIGKALGTFLKGKEKVVVGYDVRRSSKSISTALIKGITSTGCNVIELGEVPNPVVYLYSFLKKIHGVMITASHNPPEYNGFKFIRPTGVSYIEEYGEFKKIIENGKFLDGMGKVTKDDGAKIYEEFLKSNLKINKKLKVVVDCMNASGGIVMPYLFQKFGLEVIPLRNKPLGNFGGIRPEPKGNELNLLKETIIKENADFGIAFDGDADRGVLIDDKGREMVGSITIMTLMEHFIKQNPKAPIVATIDCASEIELNAKKLGSSVIWTKVGHGFIEDAVYVNKAVFGGEQSSHFYGFGVYPFSDGFMSGLKMAEFLCTTNRKLSEVIDSMKLYPTYKEYFNCGSDEKKLKVINKLSNMFDNEKRVSKIDGVKFFLNDIEWIMMRQSNNLPEVCLCIEAENDARMKELKEKYSSIIKEEIAKA